MWATSAQTTLVSEAAKDRWCTCVPLDEFFERDGHLLLHRARGVDVAGDVEELGARVPLPAKAQEPRAPASADGRRHGDGLHICNGCRASKDTCHEGWMG